MILYWLLEAALYPLVWWFYDMGEWARVISEESPLCETSAAESFY